MKQASEDDKPCYQTIIDQLIQLEEFVKDDFDITKI